MNRWVFLCFVTVLVTALVISSATAQEGVNASDLAKAAQNPVADMISVPIQYNANFSVGSGDETQHLLNIQPVYPMNLSSHWNLISRIIIPLISQPPFVAGQRRESGFGDFQLSLFISPAKVSSGVIWGGGVVGQFNTASNERLGQGKRGLGPTAVVLKISGPWVFGGLINNIWSVGGDAARADVNQMLMQPFVNYNVPEHPGLYVTFSPIITANWEADAGNAWTVPLGMGIGRIMTVGRLPVNLQTSAYYNIVKPDVVGADWQLRLQMALLFPR